MILYLTFNLGALPWCPPLDSRMLLSLASVTAIGMSMAGGFGIAALLGFEWTPVHTILPFVILGLGVDDSFVIVNAVDHTPRSQPIAERLRLALGHAATSISVTSLTDVVAL